MCTPKVNAALEFEITVAVSRRLPSRRRQPATRLRATGEITEIFA